MLHVNMPESKTSLLINQSLAPLPCLEAVVNVSVPRLT